MNVLEELMVHLFDVKKVLQDNKQYQKELRGRIQSTMFMILTEIKAILSDAGNDDFSCDGKIVSTLEKSGISCGERHAFG